MMAAGARSMMAPVTIVLTAMMALIPSCSPAVMALVVALSPHVVILRQITRPRIPGRSKEKHARDKHQ
jgi:hypothetical protein